MPVCEQCGDETRWTRGTICSNCGAELPPPEAEPLTDFNYREPTPHLRIVVFLLWFVVIITIISTMWLSMGIPLLPILPYISLIVGLILLIPLEIWVAKQLLRYNNRARKVYIIGLIVASLLSIILMIFEILYSWPTLILAVISIFILVFHKPTSILFSGKYYPEPDY